MYIALTSDSMTRGPALRLRRTPRSASASASCRGVSRVDVFGTKSAIRIKADPSAHVRRAASRSTTWPRRSASGTSYSGRRPARRPSGTALLRPQGQLDSAEAYNNLIVAARATARRSTCATSPRSGNRVQDERINMRFWVRGLRRCPRPRWSSPSTGRPAPTRWRWPRASATCCRSISAELPGSVRITPDLRPLADDRQLASHDVQETLIIAFVLVVIVIFVFLGRVDRHADPGRRAAAVAAAHVHRRCGCSATAWTTCR